MKLSCHHICLLSPAVSHQINAALNNHDENVQSQLKQTPNKTKNIQQFRNVWLWYFESAWKMLKFYLLVWMWNSATETVTETVLQFLFLHLSPVPNPTTTSAVHRVQLPSLINHFDWPLFFILYRDIVMRGKLSHIRQGVLSCHSRCAKEPESFFQTSESVAVHECTQTRVKLHLEWFEIKISLLH